MILSGIKHLMLGDALKTILFLEDGSVVTVDRLSEPRARVFLFLCALSFQCLCIFHDYFGLATSLSTFFF